VNVVLSKREKYIGIVAVAAVALLAVNSLVLSPYMDALSDIETQEKADTQTLSDNKLLLYRQKSLQKEWQVLLNSGLEVDESVAQSQTQQDLQSWARAASINLDALSSDHVQTQHGPFQVLNFNLEFNASGNRAMRQIAGMLWSIESAKIPIRLNNLRIQSVREGTDNLDVKLVVSDLYLPPANQGVSPADLFDQMDQFQ
jgi:hypothetical protein